MVRYKGNGRKDESDRHAVRYHNQSILNQSSFDQSILYIYYSLVLIHQFTIMPGKRQSDSGQIRKEEFDLMEQSSNSEPDSGMPRASKAAMAKRKIIKASRPTATPEAKKAMQSHKPSSASGKSVFGGISLKVPTNTAPFSFTTSTGNATASAAAASFPAASSRPPINITTTTSSGIKPLSKFDADKKALAQEFKVQDKTFIESWQESDPGMADQSKVMWQLLYYRYGKHAEFNKKHPKAASNKSITKPRGPGGSSAPDTKTKQPSAPNDTTSPPATAPPTFSFRAPSTVPTSAPGNTASLSSGGSLGGFVFNPNPTAAIAQGTTTTSTFTGIAANNEGTETDAQPAEENDGNDAVQKRDDPDWDLLESFKPVAVFSKTKDSKEPGIKFASGELHLEKKKKDPKKSRMVMRNDAGIKVLVNMSILPGMKFETRVSKAKKGTYGWITFMGCNYTDVNQG